MAGQDDPGARRSRLLLALLVAVFAFAIACSGGERTIILATTTSTENSGLLDALMPAFERDSGYNVKVVAVGSGAAISMGERGDVDVLLVHSPGAEEAFVRGGHGVDRASVMYNDFVIVGPANDPAGVREAEDAAAALARIAMAGSRFVSRGDDSGTHVKEQELWAAAGLTVQQGAAWYVETGQGMGSTLTVAAETGGYTLTDRGTWLVVSDRAILPVLVEGDPALFNRYHVIVIDPDRHPGTNVEGARRLRDFLIGTDAQALIGEFGVETLGRALFVPAAE
ncbi:MAG: substrate-binding domain-containing protein [Dehalococcoidia bacterium]|jgi:tungstate transport system substrate-binding protein|nr:substrate-binding domain-containing protein [Dehalococcoidia bacterium]